MAVKPSSGIQKASPLDSNMYENRKDAEKRRGGEKEESGQERQGQQDRAEFCAERRGGRIKVSKDAMALLIPARESNIKVARRIHQLRQAIADAQAAPPQAPAPRTDAPRKQNLEYFRPAGKKGAADIKA